MRIWHGQNVLIAQREIISLMIDPNALAQAIDWVIRLRDPVSADWAGFTDWLEASPYNKTAYDAAALADADMAEAVVNIPSQENIPAANDNIRHYRRYAGIAAALLVAVTAYPLYTVFSPTYSIETGLGEQRDLALGDGTIIELNGGTRVTLNKSNARIASLDYGEARFRVTHNSAAPFVVRAGGSVIKDIGTVFNVRRDDSETELAVAEGSVLFNPKAQAVLLKKGHKLRARDGQEKPVLTIVDPVIIGGWKNGRLSYEAASLGKVAADLSRAIGKHVGVAPNIAGHNFTGTILVDKKDAEALYRISALMGVRATPTADGWQLTAL
jgi:transmembrane sensor